ncbi:MAG: hypothetical protein J5871_01405 [Bacteroidales bacterium]|nr:hypothetical protein [Bacteroidales bacterium]
MKTRIFFVTLVSCVLLAFGCTTKEATSLPNIQLSKTFLAIPAGGGSVDVTVTAAEAWAFAQICNIGKDDNGSAIYAEFPAWLSCNAVSGDAGETVLTFSAAACDFGREQELQIVAGSNTQYLQIRQGTMSAVKATCQEVIDGVDGKTFTVKGVCTAIANTNYGNWYLKDDTGEIYIYGTVDANGSYNWASFNIEVGDVVEVQGPKTTYGTTVELVDVSVLQVTKSLLKLDTDAVEFPKEGGEFVVKATYKGEGVFLTQGEDWVLIRDMQCKKGVPSKIETNPADTAWISFRVLPNVDDARKGVLTLRSASGSQASEVSISVAQGSGLAAYALPYEETFLGSKGAWETQDIIPVEGVASIWTNSKDYGMVAKATKAVASQAELIGPNIDLASVSSAVLTFEHVQRYAASPAGELKLFASTDNGTSWTELQIPAYSSGKNWTYVSSGNISLKRFAGKLVMLKFQYNSSPDAYATWEIKNLKVVEGDIAPANIAELNNSATADAEVWSGTFTDAVVTYVNGKNAFIEDATGGIQLYMQDHGLVAGQTINGTVSGKVTLYNGFAELTSVDVEAATVTDGEAPVPTAMTLPALMAAYLRYQNCWVELSDVTFDTPLTLSNRNGVISSNGVTVAAYAQIKNKIEMAGTGSLICIPSRYNANLQVGVWENDHFITK